MSTPSTVSALHPSHHFYPAYPEYQTQQPQYRPNPPQNHTLNRLAYNNNHTLPAPAATPDARCPSTSQSRHSTHYAQAVSSPMTSEMLPPNGRKRQQPDWNEFYKNGKPQEVIVIDDDTPQPPPSRQKENYPESHEQAHRPQTTTSSRQPDKRRRVEGNSVYDPVYRQSNHAPPQTAYSHESLSRSVDTRDRTNSGAYSTGATSLNSAVGSVRGGTDAEEHAGQKRKRSSKTVQDVAEEVHEIFDYYPPPQPPIKANDVHVPIVQDVSSSANSFPVRSLIVPSATRTKVSSMMMTTGTTSSMKTQTLQNDVSHFGQSPEDLYPDQFQTQSLNY